MKILIALALTALAYPVVDITEVGYSYIECTELYQDEIAPLDTTGMKVLDYDEVTSTCHVSAEDLDTDSADTGV